VLNHSLLGKLLIFLGIQLNPYKCSRLSMLVILIRITGLC
jgi:hypothetical protein